MASTLYLALLCSGFETIILTDGVNYSLDNQSGGWIPALGLDEEQRTVIDAIPINILPGAGATTVRRNLIRLTQMLRQISRGQQGDGDVVTLSYISPNSTPVQRIAAQVVGWNAETFLPSVNAAENLPVDTINVVTLILEHRVPWILGGYINENLLINSAWAVNPNWTATGSGTLTYVAAPPPLPAGGQGYLQDVVAAFSTRILTAPTTQPLSVVSGQTYTVFFRVANSIAKEMNFIRLRNAIDTADISNVVALNIYPIPAGAITAGGIIIRAVLVATATESQARIRLQYSSSGVAITFQFAEFLALAGDIATEEWHRTSAEEGISATSAATALGVVQTTALTPTASAAPTNLTYTLGAAVTWLTGMLIVAKQGALVVSALPPAVAFTAGYASITDTATNYAVGGTILRYTPTVLTDVAQIITGSPQLPPGFIIIAARANGTTQTYDVFIRATLANGDVIATRRRSFPVRTLPYYAVLGRSIFRPIEDGLIISWEIVVAASATGGSIDFDWWAFVHDTHDTHIITHGVTANASQLVVDPNWITTPLPTGLNSPDSLLIKTDALALDTLWVATDTTNRWRLNPATTSPTLAIRRPPAFDAPV